MLDAMSSAAFAQTALSIYMLNIWCRYVLVQANNGSITEMFSVGRASGSCMASLSRTELLVAKDNIAVAVAPDGRPSRKVCRVVHHPGCMILLFQQRSLLPQHIFEQEHCTRKLMARNRPAGTMPVSMHSYGFANVSTRHLMPACAGWNYLEQPHQWSGNSRTTCCGNLVQQC